MTTPSTQKSFDCVAFKREAQRRIYEEIKDLTSAEEIEYFRRKVEQGPFASWWRKVRDTSAGASSPRDAAD